MINGNLKVVRVAVLQPAAFCLSKIEFLTVATTSLLNDLEHLRAVELVFLRERAI